MDTKEKIQIMQAYLDGICIESKRNSHYSEGWKDESINIDPIWDWDGRTYRIKNNKAKK